MWNALRAGLIAILVLGVTAGTSVAQGGGPTPPAPPNLPPSQGQPQGVKPRCSITAHVEPRTKARQSMNRAKKAVAFYAAQSSTAAKAAKKAGKAVKKAKASGNRSKLAKAKAALKKAKAAQKTASSVGARWKAVLPGLVQRFNQRNAAAVANGCASDDGSPKTPRG